MLLQEPKSASFSTSFCQEETSDAVSESLCVKPVYDKLAVRLKTQMKAQRITPRLCLLEDLALEHHVRWE